MGITLLGLRYYLGSGISLILAMCSQILKEFKYLQALFQLISLVSLIVASSNFTEGFFFALLDTPYTRSFTANVIIHHNIYIQII